MNHFETFQNFEGLIKGTAKLEEMYRNASIAATVHAVYVLSCFQVLLISNLLVCDYNLSRCFTVKY